MVIQFKAKPKLIGNSFWVIIPKSFINNDLIDQDKEYVFTVKGKK